MLLNEFLKEHRKNEDQKAIVSDLKLLVAKQEKRLAHQEKQIAMLTAAFERVSMQREINRPAPRLVGNND